MFTSSYLKVSARIFWIIFLGLILFSCKKNDASPSPNETNLGQFHKSINIGENYPQQPQIAFSSANSLGDPDIFYEEAIDNEHYYLKWLRLKENGDPVFKKTLQPPVNSYLYWQTGFTKTNNNEYVLSGSWWENQGFGSMFIATFNEDGELLKTKIVSSKNGDNTVRGDKIFSTRDGFVAITEYPIPSLIKLDVNASVQWSLNIVGIKNSNSSFSVVSNPVEDNAGNVFIALVDYSGNQYLIKLDASSGNIIWAKQYSISNLDGYFSPFVMKRLVIDEQDNIYMFSEYLSVNRILIIKANKDGNFINAVYAGDDCRTLYDIQYINQNFFLLTGTYNTTRCLHIQLNKNLEIQKKGVVLSAGDLSELPGKFNKSKYPDYTNFLIAGPDENNVNSWQYIRLDNNWKYPCFDYTIPAISFPNHTNITTADIQVGDINFYPSRFEYVTTEAQFILNSIPINNMSATDYCK